MVEFKAILSIQDLRTLEEQRRRKMMFMGEGNDFEGSNSDINSSNSTWDCDAQARKKWVFFHAACLRWNISEKSILSRKKGDVQRAILEWVRETPT